MAPISVFMCGTPKEHEQCSSPGCHEPAKHLCGFALGGRLAGKTCSRAVCETHGFPLFFRLNANSNKRREIVHCGPHRDFVMRSIQDKQRAAKQREMDDKSGSSFNDEEN